MWRGAQTSTSPAKEKQPYQAEKEDNNKNPHRHSNLHPGKSS